MKVKSIEIKEEFHHHSTQESGGYHTHLSCMKSWPVYDIIFEVEDGRKFKSRIPVIELMIEEKGQW